MNATEKLSFRQRTTSDSSSEDTTKLMKDILDQDNSVSYGATSAHNTESKYFENFQVDANVDYVLLMLKANFFAAAEKRPKPAIKVMTPSSQTPEILEKALAKELIKGIKAYTTAKTQETLSEGKPETSDISNKEKANKGNQEATTKNTHVEGSGNNITLDILGSKEFEMICKSSHHRQELLSWLSEIINPSCETIIKLIKSDAKAQAAVAITKNEINDKVKEYASMLGGNERLSNIFTTVIGHINILITTKTPAAFYKLAHKVEFTDNTYYELTNINKYLQIISENNSHLLGELKNWLAAANEDAMSTRIGDSLDTGRLNPAANRPYPVTLGDTPKPAIQQQAQSQKNFEILKTKILDLYSNPRYGKAIIETFFLISEIKNEIQRTDATYRLAQRITENPDNCNITQETVSHILVGGGKVKGRSNAASTAKPNKYIKGLVTTVINDLLTISSSQRNSLKNWVETGLAIGRPEQSTSIAKVCEFFQEYLLKKILEKCDSSNTLKNNFLLDSLTRQQISALQSYKLGRSGHPDQEIHKDLYYTAKNLAHLFEQPDFQELVKKLLNTIICVIDSEQYFANTGCYGNGWVTNHKHIPSIHYTHHTELNYDITFYTFLTKNSDVMTSIYNICQHPNGVFGKEFVKEFGAWLIFNYRTDVVNQTQNILSHMITKEFYGAGYNALSIVSVKPERVEEFQIDHLSEDNSHYTDTSGWEG